MKLDYCMMGKRVRARRKQLRLTQEQLAERIHRAPSFVGHIERGTRKMSMETLCEITLALNCTSDELLGLEMRDQDRIAAARELLALAQGLANKRRESEARSEIHVN